MSVIIRTKSKKAAVQKGNTTFIRDRENKKAAETYGSRKGIGGGKLDKPGGITYYWKDDNSRLKKKQKKMEK